jgi:hypothetical protein
LRLKAGYTSLWMDRGPAQVQLVLQCRTGQIAILSDQKSHARKRLKRKENASIVSFEFPSAQKSAYSKQDNKIKQHQYVSA